MSAAGPAILFVISLAAVAMVGLLNAIISARNYIEVLESTAAGNDRLSRSHDLWLDSLGDPFFLGFLLGVPNLAALGLLQLAAPEASRDFDQLAFVFLAVTWLTFPILLLSCLSTGSRIGLFSPALFLAILRRSIALFIFYSCSGAVVLFSAVLIHAATFRPGWVAIAATPLAAVCVPICLFIHARLCGRLAWCLRSRPASKRNPKAKQTTTDTGNGVRQTSTILKTSWCGTDDLPAPAASSAGEMPSAEICAEEDVEENEWTPKKKPYAFAAPSPVISAETAAHAPAHFPPEPFEVQRRQNRKPPLPKWMFFTRVWDFPFYSECIQKMVPMAALTLVMLLGVRLMLALRLV